MDIVVPAVVVLLGVFVAWKIVKGLVKMAVIVGALALAAWLYFGGVV